MTSEQQQVACAELARQMGWGYSEKMRLWIAPDVSHTRQWPPNPFTDPVASRELVAWLAANEGRWFTFIRCLAKELNPLTGESSSEIKDPTYREIVRELKLFMTAPLPVIASAACKARGIEIK